MSLGGGRESNRAADGLRAVEEFWKVKLPDTFRNLYLHYTQPFIAPCEFFTLEGIASGAGRSYGLLPQFVPFGRAVGEGGLYGFYITPDTVRGYWPILYWNEDEQCLRPAASDIDAFLRNCMLVARYETETEGDLDDDPASLFDNDEQRAVFRTLLLGTESISEAQIFGVLPRNDTELHELLLRLDPTDASSLCYLGCVRRARGDLQRALDFFHRAVEVTPWFGDSSYLLADTYRELEDNGRAILGWWSVVKSLLPLCTRTWEWDLGAEHPEADIYEVAADALRQFEPEVGFDIKSSSLWRVVVRDDPYDPDVRENYADALLAGDDLDGAEREYLNALSLSSSEKRAQPARIYAALVDIYERQGRFRDASFARFDSKLPRSAQ